MKLQIQQALATVLNIQVAQLYNPETKEFESHFVRSNDVLQTSLGNIKNSTLAYAVCAAMDLTNLESDCHYAIFPLGSNREDYYMAIEREMLRQEATQEFQGKKMWELMGADPRELITAIMTQIRECATTLVAPQMFQTALLRTGCLVIASLQWTSDWIARLRIREAHLKSGQSPAPEPIPFPSEPPPLEIKETPDNGASIE